MDSKFGVENLKVIVVAVAKVLNVASKVIHGNLFAALSLVEPLLSLRGVDFAAVGAEIGDLDTAELDVVRAAFVENLDLVNKDVQAKIAEGSASMLEAVALVEEAVSVGQKAIVLFAKFKALVGA
jgi:hypothetical protein